MNRNEDTTDLMTERHWEVVAFARRQLAARRLLWGEHPEATAPWDREETQGRRPRRAA